MTLESQRAAAEQQMASSSAVVGALHEELEALRGQVR